MIDVKRTGDDDPMEFDVVIQESNSETRHQVTMSEASYERLTADGQTPERCVEAAFLFLLDREPKESILSRFDIDVISQYFSDFERVLPTYLMKL